MIRTIGTKVSSPIPGSQEPERGSFCADSPTAPANTNFITGATASWSAPVLWRFDRDVKAAEDCRTPKPRGMYRGRISSGVSDFLTPGLSGGSGALSGRKNILGVYPGYRCAQPRANFHQPSGLGNGLMNRFDGLSNNAQEAVEEVIKTAETFFAMAGHRAEATVLMNRLNPLIFPHSAREPGTN